MRSAPLLAVAAALLGGACSAGSGGAPNHPAPGPSRAAGATASVTPATPPATTAPATTAPPTTAPAAVALTPQPSPDQAANALLDTWRRGDHAGALHLATPAAVDALFSRPSQPAQDRGCQDPLNARSSCAFMVGDGLLALQAGATLEGGWVIVGASFES